MWPGPATHQWEGVPSPLSKLRQYLQCLLLCMSCRHYFCREGQGRTLCCTHPGVVLCRWVGPFRQVQSHPLNMEILMWMKELQKQGKKCISKSSRALQKNTLKKPWLFFENWITNENNSIIARQACYETFKKKQTVSKNQQERNGALFFPTTKEDVIIKVSCAL